jgi:hypothetical protein
MVAGFCRRPQRVKICYRTDVPVSLARQRFDVARCLSRIAKYFANPRDRIVQAVVKIDEDVSRPDLRSKLLAGD